MYFEMYNFLKLIYFLLQPENILLGANDVIKLSDYGLPLGAKTAYSKTAYPGQDKGLFNSSLATA